VIRYTLKLQNLRRVRSASTPETVITKSGANSHKDEGHNDDNIPRVDNNSSRASHRYSSLSRQRASTVNSTFLATPPLPIPRAHHEVDSHNSHDHKLFYDIGDDRRDNDDMLVVSRRQKRRMTFSFLGGHTTTGSSSSSNGTTSSTGSTTIAPNSGSNSRTVPIVVVNSGDSGHVESHNDDDHDTGEHSFLVVVIHRLKIESNVKKAISEIQVHL
jgi:hypothetical protein